MNFVGIMVEPGLFVTHKARAGGFLHCRGFRLYSSTNPLYGQITYNAASQPAIP